MPTYTEDDIQALENHVVSNYMSELGPEKAADMFRDILGSLQSESGKEEFSQEDIENLAETYR